VLVEEAPIEAFVPLPVPEAAAPEVVAPAAEVGPESEDVVVILGMGTTAEVLMQLLSSLFWILTEPDCAGTPRLSRISKKIPTPCVTLTTHLILVSFIGKKLTRALALGWPAGSTLK